MGHVVSSIFTPDITPLILAAHRDNYAIIKILLDRGNRITKPHELRCACNACVQASREDSLQHSKLRINAYRALASPCFIALSSSDPILTAFELSWETKRLGRLENEFKDDYEKLSKNCEAFATALLAQTRGSTELAIVLNHDSGNSKGEDAILYGVRSDLTGQTMQLSRLRLAIKYKQKQFVAHPHCQQLLASLWYDGLPGFRRKPFIVQAGIIFLIAFLHPILCICCLIAPDSRWGGMLKKPFIKFICQSGAYIAFLGKLSKSIRLFSLKYIYYPVLLTLVALRIEFYFTNSMGQRMNSRDPYPSFFESFAIFYVIGAFTPYYGPIIEMYDEPKVQDRSKWSAYDPILVSESLFAIANIFATLKLIYVFTVSPQLGPLQISLGRMLNDILKFFCVYILVLIAFAFGLNQIYWFYAHERVSSCQGVHFSLKEGLKDIYDYCTTHGRYFSNLFEIAQSLYWSAYGLIDLSNFNLEYPHSFTEFIGKLIFGIYSAIAFIVLLNMLIAMMNNSYEQIWEQADTEWKFARSKLWISYFVEGSTLAVPFNLIPGRTAFTRLFKWCRCCNWNGEYGNDDYGWQNDKEKSQKVNENEERHAAVMRELVKRYLMHRQMDNFGQGVTEDDLNEIKGDISAFRYELLDILRDNGMKVNTNDSLRKVGRLRRKTSRLIHNAFWKVGNINLDDLDPSSDPQNNQQKSEGLPRQTMEFSIHEGIQPVEVEPSDMVENRCHIQPPIRELKLQEGSSFSGPYTNPGFVPEIEVTMPEDNGGIQTDDTLDSSSTVNEYIIQHTLSTLQDNISPSTKPESEEEEQKQTDSNEIRRTDFV
ncbi:unnamed protein product [Hymenolepis diminuta]|uniref:Transient receptor ion channel domain-containing protein n=1 Tax=Hymenolepis diminuta TaxID=6216 RepID=A0A3P7BS83_HYMDI|nr:unnamed protein product [Hymenolepis diminuta]